MLNIINKGNKVIVVSFNNENSKLNSSNANILKEKLIQLFDDGNRYVILNFTSLSFIDSTGFGSLVNVYNFANDRYAKLLLCNFSKETMELVKITKLDQIFDIYDDEDSALKSII